MQHIDRDDDCKRCWDDILICVLQMLLPAAMGCVCSFLALARCTSSDEMQTHTDSLLASHPLADGWPSTPVLRYKNLTNWLPDTLGNISLAEDFIFKAAPRYLGMPSGSQRLLSHPCDTDAWIDAQQHVRQQHGPNSFVVSLQVRVRHWHHQISRRCSRQLS